MEKQRKCKENEADLNATGASLMNAGIETRLLFVDPDLCPFLPQNNLYVLFSFICISVCIILVLTLLYLYHRSTLLKGGEVYRNHTPFWID